MIPKCCICGQFTTHYQLRVAERESVEDYWYCIRHAMPPWLRLA